VHVQELKQIANCRLAAEQEQTLAASAVATPHNYNTISCVCVCVFSIYYLHGIARSQRNCTQQDKRMIGLLLHAARCGLKNCLSKQNKNENKTLN
jgi:hypothetical protein